MSADKHLTIPGALEWDSGSVERFTIATLRYAGGSEHDVRYVSERDYDAALAREAALLEELSDHDSATLLINAWVDTHGKQIPWDKAIEIIAVATKMPDAEKARLLCLDDQYELLQQRLTVAEQRERDLEGLLRDAESAHGKMLLSDPPQEAWKYHRISARIAAALNPATGRGGCGSGKPVPPSKPVAPPIRRVVNELVINKAEIEAHTTRNWRS